MKLDLLKPNYLIVLGDSSISDKCDTRAVNMLGYILGAISIFNKSSFENYILKNG